METIELLPDLHLLRFPVGQAYLWRDTDSLTLIDTGPAGSGEHIAAAIQRLGTPDQLRQIVLTHFHDDHAGSAAEVAAWHGAPVLAHRLDAPVIRTEAPGPPPNFTDQERVLHAQIASDLPAAPPCRVDRELEDGDVIDFGGGAQVVWGPGHTDGSIGLHVPSSRVLFTGDTVASWEGQVIFGVFHIDRTRAAESFRRFANLDVDIACFGHGDPVRSDASAALRAAAAEQLTE
ncbi:MBL fold metallo-hydrolase [Micromonospora phytophila]|uniref:MBL fold metallo-hydrolase n=1 Tax=Micromonospora phytophila TaxID=709888 RepID=UPI00202DF8D6|nr:MBL fold metallo-hydrolase [Micromonospora phytophila]MCM0673342.1 MBL fold metallo-hydrolase [Micromonospora phytophila]